MLGVANRDVINSIQALQLANPFYVAAGLWIQGADSEANQVLSLNLNNPSCVKFKRFINKDKIRILALVLITMMGRKLYSEELIP